VKFDLSQNIILYLSLITTFVTLIILIFVSRQNNNIKKIVKTIRRLKYEVNKIQEYDKKLFRSLTNEDPITSWFQEDELKMHRKKHRKNLRREKIKSKISDIRQKLPKNIEFLLGENVLDKIGIGCFLVGLALFINLSMENEWINSFGRLFLGVILTIIFLILGYLLRKKYFHFSNVLIGGGIAAFIFTIFGAYYQYNIIPLVLWILSTIFIISSTIMISIAVKRHEIAIITFIAAYIAPFTVHFTGSDYFILFSYLTLLNFGIIAYDFYQKSIIINLVSFGFTFMIYGIWLVSKIYFQHEEIPFLGAFLFLTLFYIMFFLMVIINNIREGHEFHKMDFSIFMTAKGIYFGAGILIIKEAGVDYQGLFAGLIGIINYSFFLALFKRKDFDRRILNIFLGMSIMFFSLIIPIEFYGKTITMIWAFQSALLMFIVVRTKNNSMKTSSLLLSIGMIISLFIDLYDQYISTTADLEYIKPIFNQGFLSSIIAIGSLITLIFLINRLEGEFFIEKIIKKKYYQAFLAFVAVFTFYFIFLQEIRYATLQKFDNYDLVDTFTSVYNLAMLSIAALPAFFIKKKQLGITAIAIAFISSILYIFFYSSVYITLRGEFLMSTNISRWQFNIHYAGALILITTIIAALKGVSLLFKKPDLISFAVSYILLFCLVYIVSSEITHFFATKLYDPNILLQSIVKNLYRYEYSMTWGFVSLLIIIFGFIFKIKEMRIVSITLYFITTLKIIFYDFWTTTNQEMINSFAIMGVILLITSFLFQYTNKKQKEIANLD